MSIRLRSRRVHGAVVLLLAFLTAAESRAIAPGQNPGPGPGKEQGKWDQLLIREISIRFGGAQVTLTEPVRWVRGGSPSRVQSVSILGDDGKGNLHFTLHGNLDPKTFTPETSEGWVGFMALQPTRIASRRIHPGEALQVKDFYIQDIDVSKGRGYEYRGVILPEATN